jgi:hypothetical protein
MVVINTINEFCHPSEHINMLTNSWLYYLQGAREYSSIPGEPQHVEAEYSQVDKRSSQKRLLSQTSDK